MNYIPVNEEVSEYYRQSGWLYKYFWYSPISLGLNYGLWERDTKNKDQAIVNHFQYLIDKAQIKKNMKILDAGCGVGGAAVYIAKKVGAQIVGITITKEQVRDAEKNAALNGVQAMTHFKWMDYTNTKFANNSFDVIIGVESVCYAYPKSKFLKEAKRILKPGGVIMISDGYTVHKPKNERECSITSRFCKAWRLPEMIEYNQMTMEMKKIGFKEIIVEDMTSKVKPSFGEVMRLVYLARPITWLSQIWPLPLFKIIADNAEALEMSVVGVDRGLFGHFTHIAKK